MHAQPDRRVRCWSTCAARDREPRDAPPSLPRQRAESHRRFPAPPRDVIAALPDGATPCSPAARAAWSATRLACRRRGRSCVPSCAGARARPAGRRRRSCRCCWRHDGAIARRRGRERRRARAGLSPAHRRWSELTADGTLDASSRARARIARPAMNALLRRAPGRRRCRRWPSIARAATGTYGRDYQPVVDEADAGGARCPARRRAVLDAARAAGADDRGRLPNAVDRTRADSVAVALRGPHRGAHRRRHGADRALSHRRRRAVDASARSGAGRRARPDGVDRRAEREPDRDPHRALHERGHAGTDRRARAHRAGARALRLFARGAGGATTLIEEIGTRPSRPPERIPSRSTSIASPPTGACWRARRCLRASAAAAPAADVRLRRLVQNAFRTSGHRVHGPTARYLAAGTVDRPAPRGGRLAR